MGFLAPAATNRVCSVTCGSAAIHLSQDVFAAALGMCDRTSKSLSHPRSRGE